jgi:pimeloyl-ACP methyl ester carboxylesterase
MVAQKSANGHAAGRAVGQAAEVRQERKPMNRRLSLLLLVLALLAAAAAGAEEAHPGVAAEPLTIEAGDGVRLSGILTRPDGIPRPPVIHFVQWLSCDTVMLTPDQQDGWSRMLRGLIRESGYAILRVDKRGVGDSGGAPCMDLDFDTELADHRAALAALQHREDVDANRIVLFGASMGSRYVPLLAAGQAGIAGVLVWGGGALTWFERMLAFDRNALELSGTEPAAVNARMKDHARLLALYLLDGRDPPDIIREHPDLAATWSQTVGASPTGHYGRPFAFHQQAQRADWAAAWVRINAPVLVIQGQFDWFESRAGGRTVERLAPSAHFRVIPYMDHHFTLFASPQQAFADDGGRPDPRPFLDAALPWLRDLAGETR